MNGLDELRNSDFVTSAVWADDIKGINNNFYKKILYKILISNI